MRRQEIVDGSLQVVKALEGARIVEALRAVFTKRDPQSKTELNARILEAYKVYVLAADSFNPAAQAVARIFGLHRLEQAEFWIKDTMSPPAHEVFTNSRAAIEFLPKLVRLLHQDGLPSPGRPESDSVAVAFLTLLLPESLTETSKPQRLADALNAVAVLYEAVAIVEGESAADLSVVACDSGSDKSFDLFGAAKLVSALKELLLSLWDRIVFYRELQVEQRLELVSASLPILEKVSKLQQEQRIAPEQAEIIKRKVLQGVAQFLACGAVIPEMSARSQLDPRQLMAPEPKLLTSGLEREESNEKNMPEDDALDEPGDDAVGSEPLTDKEKKMYGELRKKMNQARKGKKRQL